MILCPTRDKERNFRYVPSSSIDCIRAMMFVEVKREDVWGEVQICIWPSWCHCHSLSLAPVNPDQL